jgi:hypothetical protein
MNSTLAVALPPESWAARLAPSAAGHVIDITSSLPVSVTQFEYSALHRLAS